VVVDRDRLVVLDSDTVVFAHCLDSLNKVCRYLAGESHEEVVLVGNHAALSNYGQPSR
jgi:hypothetical protein